MGVMDSAWVPVEVMVMGDVGDTTGVSATRTAWKYRDWLRPTLGSPLKFAVANAYNTNSFRVASGAFTSGWYPKDRKTSWASDVVNPAALVRDSMPTVAPLYVALLRTVLSKVTGGLGGV